jgi:DNA-binding HxlR family transcriptional regulator
MKTGIAAKSTSLRLTALQSRDVVELLADKWRIPILHVLTKRVLRTHEIQSAMRQVSPKMLTQTLRAMERDGLVERLVRPVAPPHVEYKLTSMGQSVIKPLKILCRWAEEHAAERDAARQRFDRPAKRIHSSAAATRNGTSSID